MKDVYAYPAILSFDDDGISIEYPDLPGCLSCADDIKEAKLFANEALRLHLWSMEIHRDEIPEPMDMAEIVLEDNQLSLMVEVFMPPVRERLNAQVGEGMAVVQ